MFDADDDDDARVIGGDGTVGYKLVHVTFAKGGGTWVGILRVGLCLVCSLGCLLQTC
jgi:hypothetical protein